MYNIYILRSLLDNGFYIGVTSNLKDRLLRHLNGRSRATKDRRPLRLVYYEAFNNKQDAYRRERYLKRLKNNRYIQGLIVENIKNNLVGR